MNTDVALTNIQAIPITKETVKQYICKDATDQELSLFLELCRVRNLNPFLKQAYLIKYGTAPATMVVGKDSFIERANNLPSYKGFNAGVILQNKQGEIVRSKGIVYPDHTLIGAWAIIYRDNREPLDHEVTLSEYIGKKADGTINKTWDGKSATMIRKVALVQAHREAFPSEFQGMYDESEADAMQRAEVVSETKLYEIPKEIKREEIKGDDSPLYFCTDCATPIDYAVNNFSINKMGKSLCRNCQKTPRTAMSSTAIYVNG